MALTCEIHVKYTCQVPDNSLVVFGIPKNPYFDSSHVYIASFLKILLHNANAAFFWGHPVCDPTLVSYALEQPEMLRSHYCNHNCHAQFKCIITVSALHLSCRYRFQEVFSNYKIFPTLMPIVRSDIVFQFSQLFWHSALSSKMIW